MITTAVIFADAQLGDAETPPLYALHRLGGLTLLERAIRTAEQAGARICYVVGIPQVPKISWPARSTPGCRVVFLKDSDSRSSLVPREGVVLAFSVDVIFSAALAKTLDKWLTRTGAPSVHIPDVPLAVVHSSLLTTGAWDGWRAPQQDSGSLAFAPEGYFVRQLEPTISLAVVEKELLAALANPQDGFLDRHLNRPLSRRLTRLLALLPLSANLITVLSLTVGLAAALCFAAGDYRRSVIGALLLQVSAVLDCCDGELARLRFEESALGHWLDIIGDTLVHLAVFVGIAWGVAASEHGRLPLVVGAVLVAGVLPSLALVTYAESADVVRKASRLWEGKAVARMLAILTGRDFSVLILFFALLGALRWFLWGAALGVHVFWLTLLWLLWQIREKLWDIDGPVEEER